MSEAIRPKVHLLTKQPTVGSFSPLSNAIISSFEKGELPASSCAWPSAAEIDEGIYIIVDTEEKPILSHVGSESFRNISTLLTRARRVFWVSGNIERAKTSRAHLAIATGLMRVARTEKSDLQAVMFTIKDHGSTKLSDIASAVQKAVNKAFWFFGDVETEVEYLLEDGRLLIPRLIPDARLNSVMTPSNTKATEMTAFHQSNRPLKLHIAKPGLLDSLVFVDDDYAAKEDLQPDEIELQVFAHGINFKDLFISLGQMKAGTRMAGECAGIVVRVGTAVPTSVKIGDRICAFNGTPFASNARVRYSNATHIPESMPFTIGASILITFATAYEGLVNLAHLEAGQSILIPSAAGGVGQAAIQIARHIGAQIFVTVSNEAKRHLLIEKYHIDPSHVFSSRSRHFRDGVMYLTQGQGVDVVLNSTSGEMLAEMWNCLAAFGTFVEIGKTDTSKKNRLDMGNFDKSTTFTSVDLSLLSKHKPTRTQQLLSKVLEMFVAGHISPAEPTTVMKLGEIEQAFRRIQTRSHCGKIVLDSGPSSSIRAVASKASQLMLHTNATYIITGGLGDLARQMARSMANRGAGHIVLISRRSLAAEEQSRLKNEFASLGCRLHILKTDIGTSEAVEECFRYCQSYLPPVKGIVQAAMVLKVTFLETSRSHALT